MLSNILTQYQDRCAKDQSSDYLMFMTLENKYKCLLHLIGKKYNSILYDTEYMLCGSEINSQYHINFNINIKDDE